MGVVTALAIVRPGTRVFAHHPRVADTSAHPAGAADAGGGETPQPGPRFLVVDLQPQANQRLDEDILGYGGNNLKPLPRGRQTLGGVDFEIGAGFLFLSSQMAPGFPNRITGIKLVGKVARLHFLHATGWGFSGVADGTEIGHFTVHYEDGSSATIPIEYGRDVRDWWALTESAPVTRGEVVWTGVNDASKNFQGHQVNIRMFKGTWENPDRGKNVTAIDYVSRHDTPCAPFLIALTAEPGR